MARKLYVGNLPYEAVEQDLQELFASAGSVDKRERDSRHGHRPRPRVRVC